MFNLSRFLPRLAGKVKDDTFDQYCLEMPSPQTAIDAMSGWSSAFPVEGLRAGKYPLFADSNITWAIEQMGSLQGRRVLEIGPMEGMHTFMLNQHGPEIIDAIEANRNCFLRCLITKETLGIDRARFHLGDAHQWLSNNLQRYDLIVASGVLYHMADPGEFIVKMAERCDNLYIWTHYFDDTPVSETIKVRTGLTGQVETRSCSDVPMRYFERRYNNANTKANFCGGLRDRHFWMHREDILSLLKKVGFQQIKISGESLDHPHGPCFCVFATRSV